MRTVDTRMLNIMALEERSFPVETSAQGNMKVLSRLVNLREIEADTFAAGLSMRNPVSGAFPSLVAKGLYDRCENTVSSSNGEFFL